MLVQVHSIATVSHSVACKSKTHTYVQAQKATETGKPQLTGSKADMAYDGSDVSALEQKLGNDARMLQLFHRALGIALGASEACDFAELPKTSTGTV